jgi:hypothetical protein
MEKKTWYTAQCSYRGDGCEVVEVWGVGEDASETRRCGGGFYGFFQNRALHERSRSRAREARLPFIM